MPNTWRKELSNRVNTIGDELFKVFVAMKPR